MNASLDRICASKGCSCTSFCARFSAVTRVSISAPLKSPITEMACSNLATLSRAATTLASGSTRTDATSCSRTRFSASAISVGVASKLRTFAENGESAARAPTPLFRRPPGAGGPAIEHALVAAVFRHASKTVALSVCVLVSAEDTLHEQLSASCEMSPASLSLLASSQLTCDPTGRTRGVRDPSGSTSGCRSPRAVCGSHSLRGGECARLRIQCATPTTPRPQKKHAQSDTAQGYTAHVHVTPVHPTHVCTSVTHSLIHLLTHSLARSLVWHTHTRNRVECDQCVTRVTPTHVCTTACLAFAVVAPDRKALRLSFAHRPAVLLISGFVTTADGAFLGGVFFSVRQVWRGGADESWGDGITGYFFTFSSVFFP